MSYSIAQTLLVAAFGLVYLLAPGPNIFHPGRGLTIAGDLVCLAGVLLLIAAIVTLRHAVQVAPEPKFGAVLVRTGVYRRFRHPIYTAMAAVVLGFCLKSGSLAVAIAGATLIVFLAAKVRVEERFLGARYPDYADYRRHTWGLFPGL
jgi:protein-S-isoprenylcysteine O-methyltransferase Ste14